MSKKLQSLVSLLFVAILFSNTAHAIPEWHGGTIKTVYADPSDIVFIINGAAGPCGSSYYHIQRTNTNFKEFYSLVLTAFSTGKTVYVYVTSCLNDRNIVSHGSVTN